ncbi:MAG: DUF2177 family protein [Alphaproteobacteria bacterium]
MTRFVLVYLATIIPFLAIDAVWLARVVPGFFQQRIGHLLAQDVNFGAAVGFYLLYGVGIVYFAVLPGLDAGSWRLALMNGALFGFFAYATYDMTNYATLRGYPFSVVALDVTWGTVLTGVSALIGYLIIDRFA